MPDDDFAFNTTPIAESAFAAPLPTRRTPPPGASPRRRWLLLAGRLLVIALVAAAGLLLASRGGRPAAVGASERERGGINWPVQCRCSAGGKPMSSDRELTAYPGLSTPAYFD